MEKESGLTSSMLSLEGVMLVEELDEASASATSSPSGHGTESSTDMP
jgi:hypothetical protein